MMFTKKRHFLTSFYTNIFRFHRFKTKWINPGGSSTDVLIYNPLVKSKVPLCYDPASFLTWYSCGPTVYDVAHIGHASSYIRLDIIRRVLSHWFNVKPIVALGITDIDDKIIARSRDLNEDCSKIAKKYELEFLEDMNKLNLLEPHFILRVTEHIPNIIEFIEQVINNGHAYHAEDGCVYFNTKSLTSYGKVTGAPILEEKQGNGIKLNQADFALWKSSKPGEPYWSSPWSEGRPGWHIECSAMASKVFGKQLDIHCGGLDLAFPHHENEEAQSCAHHNVNQWVNYWIHTGHLLMNGMKMSKSMKNFVSINSFLSEHTADHLRMLCLMTHYRTSIDYTPAVMNKSVALVNKFLSFLNDARAYSNGLWELGNVSSVILLQALSTSEEKIKRFLSDDINTAQVIIHLEDLVRIGNGMLHSKPNGEVREVAAMARFADFIQDSLQGMGLFSDSKKVKSNTYDFVINKSVNFRNEVRKIALASKDKDLRNELLQSCDTFRGDLKAMNIVVKDTSKSIST